MNKNTKKLLIIGGVGAAAVAGWYFFFGPGAAPAQSSASASTSQGGSTASAPALNQALLPWFQPANATVVQNLKNWIAQTSAKQQAGILNYMENYGTQTDINNLWETVSVYFAASAPAMPAALNAWWNTFSTTDTGFNGS